MPVVRESMSVLQFCDLLGIEPSRYIAVETDLRSTTVTLVLQPPDADPRDRHSPRWVKQGHTWVREVEDVMCAEHAKPLRECGPLFHG